MRDIKQLKEEIKHLKEKAELLEKIYDLEKKIKELREKNLRWCDRGDWWRQWRWESTPGGYPGYVIYPNGYFVQSGA